MCRSCCNGDALPWKQWYDKLPASVELATCYRCRQHSSRCLPPVFRPLLPLESALDEQHLETHDRGVFSCPGRLRYALDCCGWYLVRNPGLPFGTWAGEECQPHYFPLSCKFSACGLFHFTNIINQCLSACAVCFLLGFLKQRQRRMLKHRAQQVVLAIATFDADGRLLVSQSGLMPCQTITQQFHQRVSLKMSMG